MKKNLFMAGLLIAVSLLTGCTGGGGGNSSGTDKSSTGSDATSTTTSVSISMLNSKSEIQTQLENAAKEYTEKTGVSFEVYSTGAGSSPAETIAQKYAAGDPPTLAMLDPIDIYRIAEEKGVVLSDEKWAVEGGKDLGVSIQDDLFSFPFCVEGRGLIYNKQVLETALGEPFNPAEIKNLADFEALLTKLTESGIETPVILNKEDWSLGAHFLCLLYEEQDGTEQTATDFTNKLKAGEVKLIDNPRFNSLFDTFDVLKENNINKKDPMAAEYDLNASYIATGQSAFWFNGNWAWAEISEYAKDGDEFGFLPIVQPTGADDFANSQITAGGSKQVMIDKEKSSEAQVQAAKDFLDWLVFDEAGQKFLVEDCNLVPAFKNNTIEISNSLGQDIKNYVDSGNFFEGFNGSPGDHWSTLGASMQKYLAGQSDRAGLATEIEEYWAKQD